MVHILSLNLIFYLKYPGCIVSWILKFSCISAVSYPYRIKYLSFIGESGLWWVQDVRKQSDQVIEDRTYQRVHIGKYVRSGYNKFEVSKTGFQDNCDRRQWFSGFGIIRSHASDFGKYRVSRFRLGQHLPLWWKL